MCRHLRIIFGNYIPLLVASSVLILSGCAAPNVENSLPNQFGSIESSILLESESEFLEKVAGKQLKLVNDSVQATLMFNKDRTASGSLIRKGEDASTMELDWVWKNASYCRTGTIGGSEIERKCESVRFFPEVGILLSYIDADDPDEYWLFE